MEHNLSPEQKKKYERNTFIFLAVFLAPILSVIIVGGFGFTVWISQILMGPPGS
jgi:periplasmic nitrate reductase NapE